VPCRVSPRSELGWRHRAVQVDCWNTDGYGQVERSRVRANHQRAALLECANCPRVVSPAASNTGWTITEAIVRVSVRSVEAPVQQDLCIVVLRQGIRNLSQAAMGHCLTAAPAPGWMPISGAPAFRA